MSKVKQYYTDLTEKNVDDIISKYVINEISFNDAKSKIMKLDNLNLVLIKLNILIGIALVKIVVI